MTCNADIGSPHLFVKREPVAVHLWFLFVALIQRAGKFSWGVGLDLGLSPRNDETGFRIHDFSKAVAAVVRTREVTRMAIQRGLDSVSRGFDPGHGSRIHLDRSLKMCRFLVISER